MSEHIVDVVRVSIQRHPNADSLSIVNVGDYQVVVRTEDWQNKPFAAYIEPDYVVPSNRDEFKFLGQSLKEIENNGVKGYRIKTRRLRGVMSMGLLTPAPAGSQIGDNVIEQLGVVRYEPPIKGEGGTPRGPGVDAIGAPPGVYYKYDVENGYRYAENMIDGEEVVCHEKIHGASARYVCVDGQMYCSSRTEFKKESETNLWWKALSATPTLREFCEANPGVCVYGEIYGKVQDLSYGINSGVQFVAFDLLRAGRWVPYYEARSLAPSVPWVPEIYRGPFIKDLIFGMADGDSIVADWHGAKQIREGIVIKPVVGRSSHALPRVQIKVVSNEYLMRA